MIRIGVVGSLMTEYLRCGILEGGKGLIADGFDEALYRASGCIALLRNLVNTHVRDAVEILEKILCEDHVGVAFIIGIQNRKKGSPRIKPDRIVLFVFPGVLIYLIYIIVYCSKPNGSICTFAYN